MESKKRSWDQLSDNTTITGTCYNNRKQSIKKKTMELATLCGINACTIIYGRDGEIESWPENPTQAKAIIKNFKDLMNDPSKKTMVRDESLKKDVVVSGGEVGSCSENPTAAANGIIHKLEYLMNDPCQRANIADECHKEDFMVPDRVTHSWPQKSSLTEYQELLMQLESKLEALNKRIVFLRKDQQYDIRSWPAEKKQLYYSETTPLFPFDLNYPRSDKAEYCLSLSCEDFYDSHHC